MPLLLVDGRIGRREGALLVLAALVFTFVLFFSSRGPGVPSAKEAEASAESGGAPPGGGRLRLGLIACVGLGLLLSGGELLVRGAIALARAGGMSDELVGATIVAVGTSVPELAASTIAALRGHSALAVGNVVGSNIFNALLILGGAAVARPLHANLSDLRPEMAALLGMTCLGALLLRRERTLRRPEGALLLAGYAAFLTALIIR
jgi:cation:H+ antiporter